MAYIRIFYEQNCNNLNWESMHVTNAYKAYYKYMNHSISGIIRRTGVAQLGFLSMISFIAKVLYNRYKSCVLLNIIDIGLIILSMILFFITLLLSKEYYRNHDYELEAFISLYKENLDDIKLDSLNKLFKKK